MAAEGFNNSPPFNAGSVLQENTVGSLMFTKPVAKYASGARCILKINGKIAAFAFGISWRTTTQVTEIQTIDDPSPWELAPQRITVDGSISALHIPGNSAGTNLWQTDILNFLHQKYITIEVRDSNTDALLFYTGKAMVTSRSEDIRVDSLASVQLTWRAIGYRDEMKPEFVGDEDSLLGKAGSAIRGLTSF